MVINWPEMLTLLRRGYKDNPTATAETMLEGGWYRTGDLGYIDENGFLVVYDRLKDIIKYNGFVFLLLSLFAPTLDPHVLTCTVSPEKLSSITVRARGDPRKAPHRGRGSHLRSVE
jgi:hypothetical protein